MPNPDVLTGPNDLQLFYSSPWESKRQECYARFMRAQSALEGPMASPVNGIEVDDAKRAMNDAIGHMWREYRWKKLELAREAESEEASIEEAKRSAQERFEELRKEYGEPE